MDQFVTINSTSKIQQNAQIIDKRILGEVSPSYLSFNKQHILELLEGFDENTNIIADIEKKNGFSVYETIENARQDINLIDYKPNDITIEAADCLISNYYKPNLKGITFGVYGTGNLAFKIALKLVERGCRVYIFGRDDIKVNNICKLINQIAYTKNLIFSHKDIFEKLDGFISFISEENVINNQVLEHFKDNCLIVDGGIGNFTEAMIKKSLKNNHQIIRLDMRLAQDILDGYIESRTKNSFLSSIGSNHILSIPVVSGGIIGSEGTLIVDDVTYPKKVVGIANGRGGIKKNDEIRKEERKKIKEIQEYIECKVKKNI